MWRAFKKALKRAARLVVRLWIGDPRSPYEKIALDAARGVALEWAS